MTAGLERIDVHVLVPPMPYQKEVEVSGNVFYKKELGGFKICFSSERRTKVSGYATYQKEVEGFRIDYLLDN